MTLSHSIAVGMQDWVAACIISHTDNPPMHCHLHVGACAHCLMLMTGFPEWPKVMTAWGNKMLAAVHTVAYMAAIGFGLASDAFTERMAYGPHLLAPTGKLVC